MITNFFFKSYCQTRIGFYLPIDICTYLTSVIKFEFVLGSQQHKKKKKKKNEFMGVFNFMYKVQ